MNHRRSTGFTLIDLIVALFITAIIFTVGYGAINQSLHSHEELKEHQRRIAEVQNAVRVMVQDFSELAARPIRDSLGQNWLACISNQSATSELGTTTDTSAATTTSSAPATPDDDDDDDADSATDDGGPDLVAFTRGGWANPAGVQRSTLERVSYRFANGRLRRMHWTVLDATEASVPVRQDLLTHVKSVSFRFMDDSLQWQQQWPPLGTSNLRSRPFAVEVTLVLDDWGQIVRVIEVPA